MTDPDDKLRRAYRELANEEPSALIDAAILAQARARRPSRFSRWVGPVSIAAVLVLGIGVSLRMQLEQPGVETSVPSGSPEYPMPQSAVPEAPPPEKKEEFRLERAPATVAKPAAPPVVSPPPVASPPPVVSSQPAATVPAPAAAPAFVPEPPRTADKERASAVPAELGATAAPQAPAARAKREESMRDSAGALQKKSLNAMEADADPARELERIANLRESGRHAEADKALEEFRKRHPDFRIPEAMWERVRPR